MSMNYKKTLSPEKLYKWALFLLFFLFFLQTLFFALTIKEGVPPDEGYHIKLSQMYSRNFTRPVNFEGSFYLGNIEDIPFLYHWLSGRVLNLKNIILPKVNDVTVLRMFSVIISVLNLFLAYKIVKKITKDKLIHILVITMLTNTLMFVFISASVGYDPLVFLFSFLSIFLGLELLEKSSLKTLFFLAVSILLGMLTKISFLPLALIAGLFVLVDVFKKRKKYLKEIKDCFNNKEGLKFIVGGIVAICLLLFLVFNLYLGNVLKYGSLEPSCVQVMELENCMESGQFASYLGLYEMAPPREQRIEPYWYIPHWVYLMTDRIYGILGHKSMSLSYAQFMRYFFVGVMGLLLFIRKYNSENSKQNFLFVISLFYSLILMFYVNYQGYLSHGILHAAVQGRYLFPVIVPIYILVAYGLLSFKNRYIRMVIFGLVLTIFLYGNVPFFIKNFTKDWFFENSWATPLIMNMKDSIYTLTHYIKGLLP